VINEQTADRSVSEHQRLESAARCVISRITSKKFPSHLREQVAIRAHASMSDEARILLES
jgi:hypothetical protein